MDRWVCGAGSAGRGEDGGGVGRWPGAASASTACPPTPDSVPPRLPPSPPPPAHPPGQSPIGLPS